MFSCFAEVNVDPRVEHITIEIDTISISASKQNLGRGITRRLLLDTANDMRKNYPRRMTFDQVQEISDALTKILRGKGYKFHYAYIPPQKPISGNITISIIEVTLGDISVVGEGHYSNSQFVKLFKDLIHKPLYQPDIDNILRVLRRDTGVDLFAYYSRGSETHSVRLNLKTSKSSKWRILTSIDDYGPEDSGKHRARLALNVRNPFHRFDSLSVGGLTSFGEVNNSYGYLYYETPIMNLNHELALYISDGVVNIGGEFENLGLEGRTSVNELSYTNHIFSGKKITHSLSLSYAQKSNEFSSALNEPSIEPDEKADVSGLKWNAYYHGNISRHALSVKWSSGETSNQQSSGQTLTFERVGFDYKLVQNLTSSPNSFSMIFDYQYQDTDKRLPSFERTSLVGISGVRGFEPGQFSSDRSHLASLSVYFPKLKLGKSINLLANVFVDYARGSKLDENAEIDDTAEFIGSGIELGVKLGKHLDASFIFAAPVSSEADSKTDFRAQNSAFALSYRW